MTEDVVCARWLAVVGPFIVILFDEKKVNRFSFMRRAASHWITCE